MFNITVIYDGHSAIDFLNLLQTSMKPACCVASRSRVQRSNRRLSMPRSIVPCLRSPFDGVQKSRLQGLLASSHFDKNYESDIFRIRARWGPGLSQGSGIDSILS